MAGAGYTFTGARAFCALRLKTPATGKQFVSVNRDIPQLSCLVLARQDEHHKQVSAWLGVSKRVGSVTAVKDEASLCKQLTCAPGCQLCIIVIDNAEQSLPACTLRYPDMRLLVLTTSRKSGKLTRWLQQGATDVVRLKKSDAAQHAISRLIDECISDVQQQLLKDRLRQLDYEVNYLKSMLQSDKRSFLITASNEPRYSAIEQIESDLHCIKPPKIKDIVAKQKLRDVATGLPARTTVMERFQKMLQSEIKAPRFTATLVRILTDKNTKEQSGAEKTVQDLTLYRAADALQKRMVQGTILGRVNQNALLLIQSSDIEPASRDGANRVRKTLGSLGGLIDSERDVRINTMTLPAKTRISVDEVVARLESR